LIPTRFEQLYLNSYERECQLQLLIIEVVRERLSASLLERPIDEAIMMKAEAKRRQKTGKINAPMMQQT
jgi:hypothetical protein